jgi:hypothetical protein
MTLDPGASTEGSSAASSLLAQVGEGGGAQDSDAGGQVRKFAFRLLFLVLVAGLVLLIVFFSFLRHWTAIHTGTIYSSTNPIYYNFWSGFGSDLGEATLISAVSIGVYTGVRKANCHTKRCWRIGHHPLEGTPYHLCRYHHPDVPIGGASHEQILLQHRKYKEAQRAAASGTAGPPTLSDQPR